MLQSLHLSPRFSWSKKTGDNATTSKVKQRNKGGTNYAAGHDMHIHNGTSEKKKSAPYAFFEAAVGSRIDMSFVVCKAHNLSDQPVFIESIQVLGGEYTAQDRLVRPNSEANLPQIDNLPWQDADTPIFVDMIYRDTDHNRYRARHATQLRHMAIEKYKIEQILRPEKIEQL